MMAQLGARSVSVNDANTLEIFDDYMMRRGAFSAEAKKDQFPDAFIISALRTVASAEEPIIAVTNDGDFRAALKDDAAFRLCRSIEELLEILELKTSAPDASGFLTASQEALIKLFTEELDDFGLNIADHERGNVDSFKVLEVDVHDVSSFSSTQLGEPLLLIGSATIKLEVNWSGPNWDTAAYDSEEKVYIPWDDTSGTTETSIDVDFSLSVLLDDTGKPEEIVDASITANSMIWIYVHAEELE
jgi:hypothetical protein